MIIKGANLRIMNCIITGASRGLGKAIAEKFGGGGHRNAAGCTLRGTWEEAEAEVMQLLNEAIEKAGGDVDKTEDALLHPATSLNSRVETEVRR